MKIGWLPEVHNEFWRRLLVAESGFRLKRGGFEGSPGGRELAFLEIEFANVSELEV
jgi:hypothetical protein